MDFQDSYLRSDAVPLRKKYMKVELFTNVLAKQQYQPRFSFMENIRVPGGEIAASREIEGNRR